MYTTKLENEHFTPAFYSYHGNLQLKKTIQKVILYSKTGLKVRFKDIRKQKNLSQIYIFQTTSFAKKAI